MGRKKNVLPPAWSVLKEALREEATPFVSHGMEEKGKIVALSHEFGGEKGPPTTCRKGKKKKGYRLENLFLCRRLRRELPKREDQAVFVDRGQEKKKKGTLYLKQKKPRVHPLR